MGIVSKFKKELKMKYSIVYTSKSGNTEKLALAIKEAANGECLQCVNFLHTSFDFSCE